MKKFKLVREYPGSPKLGTIVESKMFNGQCFTDEPSKRYDMYPEFWQEVKPVFISDDGVEMFVGDSYWANLADFSDVVMLEITDTTPKDNVLSFKRFSTKEAALKYIDLHKLKYSKSDIIETLRIAKYYSDFKHLLGEL
mgnify:CR=1 FL=1